MSADSTPLIHTLTYESAPAVEWLIEAFNLDLSLISRLGGHSQPRTHRGKERFPGMTITYALMEKFEDIASKDPSRAQVIVNAKVTKLLEEAGSVVGVEYEQDGQTTTELGPVVIATGGFGADFSDNSILKQVRPDLMHLPTTNGDHCTGDGIKLSQALGGATVDLPAVQVHPTGLVHPKEPDAKIKFLAAEALRGVGGLLLDKNGKRFCNELGTRDYVTGEMWKRDAAPYRLVLNGKGVKEIEWHIKHYVGRGLMRMAKGADGLAKELGVESRTILNTFRQYNEVAKKGGDEFNKKYFQNLPWDAQDDFAVAIVTPVVHYTMGGVAINERAEILREKGGVIPGLWAGGEVAGGVHGKNRLGGSGLLGAVVYGRVAGASASKFLLDQLSVQRAERRLGAVSQQLFNSFHLQSKPDSLVITLSYANDQNGAGAAPASSSHHAASASSSSSHPAAASPAASSSSSAAPAPKGGKAAGGGKERPAQKQYSMEEVAQHASESDCWVVVNGQVLNATSFLNKHPGGKEAILLYAGKEATEEFNMLHKPDVVEKYAPEIIIGTIKK